jgi:hypothetical protein
MTVKCLSWRFDKILHCWQAVIDLKATDYVINGALNEEGNATFELWRLHKGQKLIDYGPAPDLETAKKDMQIIIAGDAVNL